MAGNTRIPMVSSEIYGIWNSYVSDSLIVCVLKYYINRVEDNEVRTLMQQALDMSNQHIQTVTVFFNQEELPLPAGFTDNDVDINAPRLFTDVFYLLYLSYMARVGMQYYTMTLNHIARPDLRGYFSKRINESVALYNKLADLRLSKGLFIRAPRVEVPKEVQYIESQSFMMDLFGEKRPLILREITHMFSFILSNIVGRAVSTAFGQVSKTKKVSDFMFRGKDLSTKQIEIFSSLLISESIPTPSNYDTFVTDSTAAPFSEKLMMFHMVTLSSSAVSTIGMALADTLRADLQANYIRLTPEIMKYAKEGMDIMIENKWFEQPPQAIKHENLVGNLK